MRIRKRSLCEQAVWLVVCGLMLFVWDACSLRREAAGQDAFENDVYLPRHATGFRIKGLAEGKSTLVCIGNPWQGAEDVEQAYFIRRENEAVPDGFDGVVIPAGVRRVVCMSSGYVAMLDALGLAECVVGVSGLDFIHCPTIVARRDSVCEMGVEIDYEQLLTLKPDVVMLYGVNEGQTLLTDKLTELGIPYIYIGEYLEETPLGKAEWLRVVAELTDTPERGEQVFNGIEDRYNALCEQVNGVTERPSVMFNTPWNDTWFMPSPRNYMVAFVEDAGGRYVYTQASGASASSSTVGLETAYALLNEADVWLNPGSVTTLDELIAQNSHFANAKAVRRHTVYNNNLRLNAYGGNDFWESSVVYPDRVLRDLITILHPEILSEEFCYYRRLN